jgi:hypothetical protein
MGEWGKEGKVGFYGVGKGKKKKKKRGEKKKRKKEKSLENLHCSH